MEDFQRACWLNNQAVSFLVSGHDVQAEYVFRESIVAMKKAADVCDRQAMQKDSNQEGPDGTDQLLVSTSKILHHPHPSPSNDSDEMFIYDQAFTIDHVMVRDLPSMIPLCSALVLFNRAILFHYQGGFERGGKYEESQLQKALVDYELVLLLLRNCETEIVVSRTLSLLSLNNMAHIYYQSHDQHDRVVLCRMAMSRLLLLMSSSPLTAETHSPYHGHDGLAIVSAVSERDIQEILLNWTLPCPPTTAQAA